MHRFSNFQFNLPCALTHRLNWTKMYYGCNFRKSQQMFVLWPRNIRHAEFTCWPKL